MATEKEPQELKEIREDIEKVGRSGKTTGVAMAISRILGFMNEEDVYEIHMKDVDRIGKECLSDIDSGKDVAELINQMTRLAQKKNTKDIIA